MSPHEEPHLIYSEDLWFEWFLDGILNADIDGKGGAPILHYLLDLNILTLSSVLLFNSIYSHTN